MPRFNYRVLNQVGAVLEGIITAPSSTTAAEELRSRGLVPLEIASTEDRPEKTSDSWLGKPGFRDLLIFTSQLAAMLRAGMILPDALLIIGNQCENARLRRVVLEVRESVTGGASLSDSMRRYPQVWDRLYCNMVQVGETSGRLGDILGKLAGHLESAQMLRSGIVSALIYPLVIVVVGMISVSVLLVFVIPNLSKAFLELDIQLPLLTKLVIKLSDGVTDYWWAPLLALISVVYGVRRVFSDPRGRYWLDEKRRKIPIFGATTDKVHLSRMAQTMEILVKSGIPVLTALELASETTASPVLSKALRETAERVKRGERIAKSLEQTNVVPGMVTNLIAVGEESGRLDEMLAQIAAQYELEVNIAVKRLISMFEPTVIVIMAVLVGTFVLAFLLPMLTIAQGIDIR